MVYERGMRASARNTEKFDRQWETLFDALVKYKEENGHCILRRPWEDKILGRWVNRQRSCLAAGLMKPERKDKLDELGFVWKVGVCDGSSSLQERTWDELYERLLEFQEEHGHCRVPRSFDKWDLGTWVSSQRRANLTIDHRRAERLNAIGFEWTLRTEDILWDSSFSRLKAYKTIHGDCHVTNKKDPQLFLWAGQQRRRNKDSGLPSERKQLFSELGFFFADVRLQQFDEQWNDVFDKLKLYKQEHGHCRAVQISGYEKIPGLAEWVYRQRISNKKGIMCSDRRAKLDGLGFQWHGRTAEAGRKWHALYERLKTYKQYAGDCMVPRVYKDDHELASWVREQRNAFARGGMGSERYGKLDAICFVWTVNKRKRSHEQEGPSK
jgi:hypothetical protein